MVTYIVDSRGMRDLHCRCAVIMFRRSAPKAENICGRPAEGQMTAWYEGVED